MKKYQIILADPPWPIKWPASPSIGTKPLPYATMPVAEICALPVWKIADDFSMLFLWTTNEFLPEALWVARHWKFQYDKLWTWCKPTGAGGHPRNATEHIVVARRGTLKSLSNHEKAVNNWFIAPTRGHSVKPKEARDLIEHCYPNVTRKIELFARERVLGWDTWGLETHCDIDLESLKDV